MNTLLVEDKYLNHVMKALLLRNDFHELDKASEFSESDLYLDKKSVSLYTKHDKIWLKIRYQLYIALNDEFVRFAFHGYLDKNEQIKTRECHSLRHKVTSEGIEKLLNDQNIGIIIKELLN